MSSAASSSSPSPSSWLALLPFALFLLLFVGVGSYFESQGVAFAFYKIPATVLILPPLILALLLSKQRLGDSLETFLKGAGHANIMAMCMIYLLAGAFAVVTQTIGGVDATVTFGLNWIPTQYLLPGFFLLATFLATAMGTSMGTLATLAPIALGVAEQVQLDLVMMAGALLSGAFFGDNLSMISDSTIAATRTQGCAMQDKFKENLKLAVPACVLTCIAFASVEQGHLVLPTQSVNGYLMLPYLGILVMAMLGMNVFAVLALGIISSGLIGFWQQDYALTHFTQDMVLGFEKMQEIFLLSILVGGLAELVKQQGGLNLMMQGIERMMQACSSSKQQISRRGAELGIANLIGLTNLCVANNVVAVVMVGDVVKKMAAQHGISPKRAASLLDIFASVIQALLPYGAQALLVASTFAISPLEAVSHAWYTMILGTLAIGSMARRRPQTTTTMAEKPSAS